MTILKKSIIASTWQHWKMVYLDLCQKFNIVGNIKWYNNAPRLSWEWKQ